MLLRSTFCVALLLVVGCGTDDATALRPILGEPTWVVPGAGLPEELALGQANNNLDVVRHGDRVFLAFRSAPNHWASPDVTLFVVSSTDQVTWRLEGSFHLGTDLREPRFLSFDGELSLYFAELGTDPQAFEPGETRVVRYVAPGEWSEPEPFYLPTFIPWRFKVRDGVVYLMGYTGGGGIYTPEADPVEIHFLASSDGRAFTPVVGDDAVVLRGGGSETDFELLADGSLVAVVRNEAGDADGFGSKICRAPADALATWECEPDPKKYDSPLVLVRHDAVYLVGRRNVTETGNYDLFNDKLSVEEQYLYYQLEYWFEPKRCALWRVDPNALTVTHVEDLPSRGDTCFASIIPDGERDWIYNYTSPLEGEDISWNEGQQGPTHIYRIPLRFAGE